LPSLAQRCRQPAGRHFLAWLRDHAANAGFRIRQSSRQHLRPEQATNWSIGGESRDDVPQGADVQATWYTVKITGVLRAFGNPTTNAFNQGSLGFSYIIPTDLIGVDPACNNNLTPTTCRNSRAWCKRS